MSHRDFSFKRVSDCQNADAQGVCGLSDTGRECSRLTDDYYGHSNFAVPFVVVKFIENGSSWGFGCAQFSTELLSIWA